jgi:KDO2-lipid IV(A) lauroyltransferase
MFFPDPMAKDQPIPIQFAQYAALRFVAGAINCFDVDQNLHVAAGVGSFLCRRWASRRARAEANIAASFPEWSEDRVSLIAERSFQHMIQMFSVDAVITPRLITPATWPRHIRIGDIRAMVDELVRHEPMILVTGHVGNWELLGHALGLYGYPVAALARPLDNRFINRWLMGIRESRGMKIITKFGATPIVDDILDQGGRIGFTADQNAGTQGLFVPFFGRLASSYKSIGLLAMRHRVSIAAGFARRLNERLEYEVACQDFITPGEWADHPDPLFYITARFNRAIEGMIRAAPDQYLWLHRRWKSRPKHERLGRPVPERLVDKLRSLPWITEEELEGIVERSNRAARERKA